MTPSFSVCAKKLDRLLAATPQGHVPRMQVVGFARLLADYAISHRDFPQLVSGFTDSTNRTGAYFVTPHAESPPMPPANGTRASPGSDDQSRLNARHIAAELRQRGHDIDVRCPDVVDSTQDVAREAVRDGADRSVLVVARRQTGGRGRRGRRWVHTPGGLAFTLAVRLPPDAPPAWPTMAAALGAVRAIEAHTSIALGIKWPNDLVHGGRKVGGVLGRGSRPLVAGGRGAERQRRPRSGGRRPNDVAGRGGRWRARPRGAADRARGGNRGHAAGRRGGAPRAAAALERAFGGVGCAGRRERPDGHVYGPRRGPAGRRQPASGPWATGRAASSARARFHCAWIGTHDARTRAALARVGGGDRPGARPAAVRPGLGSGTPPASGRALPEHRAHPDPPADRSGDVFRPRHVARTARSTRASSSSSTARCRSSWSMD